VKEIVMNSIIDFIRALQRPTIVYVTIFSLVGLLVFLTIKFGSAETADTILKWALGVGATIIGFLFRDRVKPGGGAA